MYIIYMNEINIADSTKPIMLFVNQKNRFRFDVVKSYIVQSHVDYSRSEEFSIYDLFRNFS